MSASEPLATGGVVGPASEAPDQHAPAEALRAAADAFDAAHARTLDQHQITAAIADAVWPLALTEGRRQATEGWEREWGAQYRDDSWVQATFDSEAEAVEFAAGAIGHRAVSRLVGPWEPTEQAEAPAWPYGSGPGGYHMPGDHPQTAEQAQAPAQPRSIGNCPRCQQPVTEMRADPVLTMPTSAGFMEVWTVQRRFEPCGCTEIRDVRPRDEDEQSDDDAHMAAMEERHQHEDEQAQDGAR